MAVLLGGLVGAIIAMLILSRVVRWALRFMGDTTNRVLATAAISYVVGIILAGLGNADGGPWNPGSSWWLYGVGMLVWLAVDWFGLQGRQAKAKRASRL